MIIEDEELRSLFKTSSEEHLEHLEAGLLHLEKHPNDRERLQELLREAHTLKGDARMLGVKDVETLIHQIEHILGTLKETALTQDVSDRLYSGLDAIRKIVRESVTGEAAGVNTFVVLAQLMGAKTEAPPQPTPPNKEYVEPQLETIEAVTKSVEALIQVDVETANAELIETIDSVLPQLEAAQKVAEEIAEQVEAAMPQMAGVGTSKTDSDRISVIPDVSAQNGNAIALPPVTAPTEPVTDGKSSESAPGTATTTNYRIDTIRVETRNLDALMTQAGELTVSKIRIAHRVAEIEEIVALWEEWSRDNSVHRFIFDSQNSTSRAFSRHNRGGKDLNSFYHRANERLEQLGNLINNLRTSAVEDVTRLETIAGELEDGIRTLRLLPLSTIFNVLPRLVRDLARQQGKEVNFVIEGGDTKADKRILEEMKDPLMHMIRNCIDHGIETPAERKLLGKSPVATLRLMGYQTGNSIVIEVADDGRGLNTEKIKETALRRGISSKEELDAMTPRQVQSLIFAPGFSTRTTVTEVSGRGVGLDVVRTNVERLKGAIEVESNPGQGCTFRLQLRTTLTTAHVLIVDVAGITYALPVEFVETAQLVRPEDIFTIEGRETIVLDNQPISVTRLADLLEISSGSYNISNDVKSLPCIILKAGEERLGLLVDALLDEQDVILKPQSKLLKRIRNVAGATILGTGEVCMVLNPTDLMKSVTRRPGSGLVSVSVTQNPMATAIHSKPVVLLAEDSIAIRTQEKRILEGAGYEVITAVDGLDGLNKLKTRSFDAVVSDVEMPNMDGLTLAARIRQNNEYRELPIILVTSLASEEDKRRGAEAGANAYITKGNFNQQVLVDTLRRLV